MISSAIFLQVETIVPIHPLNNPFFLIVTKTPAFSLRSFEEIFSGTFIPTESRSKGRKSTVEWREFSSSFLFSPYFITKLCKV